jgi:DNA repair and recombination protein RAD52
MSDSGVSMAAAESPSNTGTVSVRERLSQYLGPEFISKRDGPSRQKLAYIEGHRLITLANEVFGFDGWSTRVISRHIDFIECAKDGNFIGTWSAGVAVVIRVILSEAHGGTSHEDLGYGLVERCRDRGQALQKVSKEAVTDGMKRALRQFGEILGNCLYNKEYMQCVAKVKGPYDRIDFDEGRLYRLKINESRKRRRMENNAVTGEGLQKDLPIVGLSADVREDSLFDADDEDMLNMVFEEDFVI